MPDPDPAARAQDPVTPQPGKPAPQPEIPDPPGQPGAPPEAPQPPPQEVPPPATPPEIPPTARADPLFHEMAAEDTSSTIALAGHPLHAMMVHFPIALGFATLGADLMLWWGGDPFWLRAGLWLAGAAALTGMAAGIVGLAELLAVRGIRLRVTGWAHGVAAVTLVAVLTMNWGLRLTDPAAVLPTGLALSGLAAVLTGVSGWHGGKLVYHHGLAIAERDETGEGAGA